MTEKVSYEELERRYAQLAQTMGADLSQVTHEECVQVAAVLNKVKTAIMHERPEETGAFFVTGEAGDRDDVGLPEYIMICPTMGLAGFATYRKFRNYSEPGY